jgi:hypothetical protein
VQVVATLEELAPAGHIVVCSIHQPHSSNLTMTCTLLLCHIHICVF